MIGHGIEVGCTEVESLEFIAVATWGEGNRKQQ